MGNDIKILYCDPNFSEKSLRNSDLNALTRTDVIQNSSKLLRFTQTIIIERLLNTKSSKPTTKTI